MFRNALSRLAVPVVAAAALMVAAGPALAQHGGGHAGGGFHSGGFRPSGFRPGGVGGVHRGGSSFRVYGGYRGYGPYYGGYSAYPYYGYYPSTDYGYYPSTDYGYYPSYNSLSDSAYGRGLYTYPPASPSVGYDAGIVPSTPVVDPSVSTTDAPAGRASHITVRLPDNAELWFNGTQMPATGPVREFNSPPLNPGQKYSYEIHARWTDNDSTTDLKKTVEFTPGDSLEVLFPAPSGAVTAGVTPASQ